MSVDTGARGVVDVDSLFRVSLSSSENATEGEGEKPSHDLRHILEGMEVFVVDSDGKVVGGQWVGG